jgi:hypothetical protein
MKTYLITLVAGIAIGIIFSLLFSSFGSNSVVRTTTSLISPAAIIAYTKRIEMHYQIKLDSLQKENQGLQKKITSTQLALRQSKQQYSSLERDISDLIFTNETATDTAQLLTNCDTLATMVTELIHENGVKDSLYENLAIDLQQQLSGKDSIISWQQQQNDTLNILLDTTIAQQQDLLKVNQQQQKQLKRQRRGGKLLSVVLFIAGGFTTYKIIQ